MLDDGPTAGGSLETEQSEVKMATITIELPDSIVKELESVPGEIFRRVLEAVALEGYRSTKLSRLDVRKLLGLSWQDTEDFLAKHGLDYQFAIADLNEDRENLAIALRRQ
jgi:hypothetical protein